MPVALDRERCHALGRGLADIKSNPALSDSGRDVGLYSPRYMQGLGLCEKATVPVGLVAVASGGHLTFELPAGIARSIHGRFWSNVRTNQKAAHVAHYLLGDSEGKTAPRKH